LKDSIEFPDYFVCPDADMKRGFFLPVNKFSFGLKEGEGMLDAERLHLLSHGDWFTVFRYTPQASSEGCAQDSIIIKRTPINNSTFKYLLHEKTMLRYLNGSERIAVERLDGGFASLLVWNMNNGSYQNERFIAYENGGRPLEVQFFKDNSPPPSIPLILHIAQDLLQALIFLFDKRVVHRNLNLGTVVFSEAGGAKLIALGSAKYINHLPYEERIRCFEGSSAPPQQQDRADALRGVKCGVGSSENDPPTTKTKPEYFVHPERERRVTSICIKP
jgi:serine/threonine protein kinase